MNRKELEDMIILIAGKQRGSKGRFAEIIGVSPQTLSFWLSGKRKMGRSAVDKIRLIAKNIELKEEMRTNNSQYICPSCRAVLTAGMKE